nr:RNA-directed DNA polymerase, eukaryota [Tanacetum cinerariifolium]
MDNVNVHVVSSSDHWMSQADVTGVADNVPNDPCTCYISSSGGIQELRVITDNYYLETRLKGRIVDKTAKRFNKSSHNTFHKTVGNKDIGNSFVNVVKGSGMSLEMESTPTIVLDDVCLNTKDLSYSLTGRVKEFTSLSNLKKVLCNEGFDVLKISYLGELWVLIEFESAKVKDLFKKNGGANSWFLVLNQASEDFTLGGRIAWVEVEGIPFKHWSGHTFNLYWMRAKEVPGWTPEFTEEEEENDVSVEDNHGGIHSDKEINNCNDESDVEEVPETCFNVPEGIFRTKEDEVLKISISIFVSNFPDSFSSKDLFHACKQYGHVVDSFIPSKRAKDGHTFNRIASKWGKLKEVDDYDDTNFHSKILCILTTVYQNILESFKIILRGKVYWMRAKEVPGWTPKFTEEEEEDDVSVKDNHGGIHSDQEINNCNDESDVEEVPKTGFNVPEGQKGNPSEDPFGIYPLLNKDKNIREHKINEEEFSLKHPRDSPRLNSRGVLAKLKEDLRMFDDAIDKGNSPVEMVHKRLETLNKIQQVNNTHMSEVAQKDKIKWVVEGDENTKFFHGLNEVHLGGSAFTWCHKSATKMTIFDYGPIPFRFYNYWLEVDGFDKLVRDAWNDAPGNKKNAIRNFMYKLKYTKEIIRGWLSTYRLNSRGALAKLKQDLRMFDEAIDKGNSPVEMVHKRLETLNKIQQVNNTHMSKVAQNAKIKWVVEGDENTKFFHGMLNKKRNQKSIRRDDLERMVTKEEVKKAVWDCGSDKSPGPDGFSFSFFRHFWSTIEKDIFEAVDCFFTIGDMPNGCN